jgi:hypothetical protein
VTIANPPAASVGSPFTFNSGSSFSGSNLVFAAVRTDSGLNSPPGALPDWLSFNPLTGVFSGTPTSLDVGSITVKVTATNQAGAVSTGTFTLTVNTASPVNPPVVTTLPFTEHFDTVTPPALPLTITVQVPQFATVAAPTGFPPTGNTNVLQATRQNVNDRPVATVNLDNPGTTGLVSTVTANVSPGGGNGGSLWSNAVIVFDYVDANNYKYAGVFEIIDQLVIGQIVNGSRQPLRRLSFPTAANDVTPLRLTINRAQNSATLTATNTGATLTQTFSSIGTGTVGVGTINANAQFDELTVSS